MKRAVHTPEPWVLDESHPVSIRSQRNLSTPTSASLEAVTITLRPMLA